MTLPAEFLALRREALIIACDRVFNGSTEPIPELPACPGHYQPRGDTINRELAAMERERNSQCENRKGIRYLPNQTKAPEDRMQTMLKKAGLLWAEMESAQLAAVFAAKRQQYYSNASSAKRFAQLHGLPIPQFPIAPESHFPGARPRGRWVA